MKNEFVDHVFLNSLKGCFGDYNTEDTICTKMCALRLRCTIEHNQNMRMELIEDLVSSDGILLKIQ